MPRIAVIDNSKLKDMNRKKFIQSLCPVNRAGKECIYFEGEKLLIDENLCIGCGICVNRAPEAINIINLPSELDQPIHKYGKNGFRLYNLPTPIFGKVVGILGRNGIGKSTAIKILAGRLKPNFGSEQEASYDKLIEFFKGSESQLFFEKIKAGKIKISYKPQQVDLIPKASKGKVMDLLTKVDEKGELDKVSKELQIDKILDHNIENVSGGELQRIAIAATVLKKANFYVFDEPASYLDIKQRINVGKFIRNLADENTAVMIVEHDLIILDYMTDLIHIMYGKVGCYGVVSGVKATKTGINTYLEGYLKQENVRFRDKKIVFLTKPPYVKAEGESLISWNGVEKKLDSFTLKAEEGSVGRKDVIGILGENAIGKTTFVKILADVIRQDKGKVEGKVKVSYKPQYISTNSDVLVVDLLKEHFERYNTELVKPLGIDEFVNKKLSQLSGGELHRVAIAVCLGKDADLYLLDEPSAYLDVEQRLIVSKVIRDLMEHKGKTALVVDHDLLFIDYLSHRLIVFEGEPAKIGNVLGPYSMEDGMNLFLKDLKITLRRDAESNRPRINKPDSQMDKKQKSEGKLYYL